MSVFLHDDNVSVMDINEKVTKPSKSVNTYTSEEVLKECVAYFGGDELAAQVWLGKYALKDSFGKIYEKSPEEMHHRLAAELARIEKRYPNPVDEDVIFQLLQDFTFLVPQGGSMAGIGNPYQIASLSNCFVIGNLKNSDSYGGIMKSDEEQVQLMKRRGGVGHDLSHIRPQGMPVMNSALTSSGMLPFMERFSNSTREVAQDGRRGALMLSISIKHPDAETFIDAKLDGRKVTGANVSVRVDDEFMKAALAGDIYKQQYPVGSETPVFTREIDAAALWNKIIHNAWKSAEPGVLFWDTVIRESVPDCYADHGFETVSTNPCGEIPLCPYDSCRLLAINLFSYVENPFSGQAVFNEEKFRNHVYIAQKMMDNLVDLELEKIDIILNKIKNDPETDDVKRTETELWLKIKDKCIQGRRTGLGITGLGDMLASLGIQYGSDKSIAFCENLQKILAITAYSSSVDMARDRGAFPLYDAGKENKNPFINRLFEADADLEQRMKLHGRRNISMLTIAPTGTTSIMTQTTSGIEPAFKVVYKRRRKINPGDKNARVDLVDDSGDSWEEYPVFHHQFMEWLRSKNIDPASLEQADNDRLDTLILESPYHNSTANDIDWIKKVELQGRLQKWVDHSISVTVNVPEETPEQVVADIYRTGWESGCKGMTIYREGSRLGVLVAHDKEKAGDENIFSETHAPKRPDVLEARVIRFMNNQEKWIAVAGLMNGKPYEIFTGKAEGSFSLPSWVDTGFVSKCKTQHGKSRYDFTYTDKDGYRVIIEGLSRAFDPEFWNYAKLISAVLRHGMPIHFAVEMVSDMNLMDSSLNTWKNGVVRALSMFIPKGTKAVNRECSECGEESLVYEEGCLNCKNCGHSECG